MKLHFTLLSILIFAATPAILAQGFFNQQKTEDWLVKGIQSDGSEFGIAFTSRVLLRTDDSGQTWQKLEPPLSPTEEISAILMRRGELIVLLGDPSTQLLTLSRSVDGGRSWSRILLTTDSSVLRRADLMKAAITENSDSSLVIDFRFPTSSNFSGTMRFALTDSGFLRFVERTVVLASADEPKQITSGDWTVETDGTCASFKTGCIQETKIVSRGADITPPQIKALAAIEKERARTEAAVTQMFALPPGGNTRISLNRGFDKCQAGSIAQMQTWWNNSPLYDTNIYFSGRNRACPSQPLSTTWTDQVTAMGWGLIPTVVGYQSPCTASTTTVKLSYDVVVAETQGRGEADIAVTDATTIGLTTGSILYYDMERYDPPSPDTLGCRAATVAFLKGWTDRIKELGYKSGVYGSPKNAQEDWVNLPPASKMDAIWMARWDNIPNVWTYLTFPTFPTNEWANHQRIKQWQAPHNETWGGVTFNIDGNISDGPVAGITIARNKNADFDGDGKTDISLFRPDNGAWYVINSSNSTFVAVGFGVATDIPAPADFDGDGRTDYSIFRPADATWHILTKAGFYSSRQFGATGDKPVPADYNGDGKADTAVFRPSNTVWYIQNSDSQGTFTFVQFGVSGDKPVPADYDGDGKTDIGVFRPNGTGGAEWWIQRSTLGLLAAQFGSAADQPVEGDYTGDGKADAAFFQPSTGTWFVLRSEDLSYFGFPFGTSGDIPSPGDFDGDGKTDSAVFRPSTGAWYVLRTTGGVTSLYFGLAGDRPIPAAYLPQ